MATKRIDYIDAIKGFSVLWVVLYHFDLTGVRGEKRCVSKFGRSENI